MYIDRERKMIYLAHPRTASTATAAFLQTIGFEPSHGHHSMMWSPGCPITEDERGEYEVFTTIRNHYDTLVSWFHVYLDTALTELPIIEASFYRSLDPKYVKPHSLWWMHMPDADVILRYETLDEDLSLLLGLDVEVPFKNVSRRRGDKHYSAFYSERAREHAEARFSEEIERCGYDFEQE